MKETLSSSETSGVIRTTLRNTPEDAILHSVISVRRMILLQITSGLNYEDVNSDKKGNLFAFLTTTAGYSYLKYFLQQALNLIHSISISQRPIKSRCKY
jgi:hypothetical protein